MKKPTVLSLVGPTASGKTELSLLLAEKLSAEIVSADSRQIFRHLNIGTAKPSPHARNRIPHHLVDYLEPTEEYSAGQYAQDARRIFREILGRGHVPLLVGGSGLYIKAAIDGLADLPSADKAIRAELTEQYRRNGIAPLIEELKRVDPEAGSLTERQNARRVIRALEVYRMTGVPLSEFHKTQGVTSGECEFIQIGLRWPRNALNDRIDARVDRMMSDGLVEETRNLLRMGYGRELNALNTVGYKEICDFLENRLSLDATVELIKRNTRRFAKRQMTWFNADQRISWILVPDQVDWMDIARSAVELYTAASRDTR